MNTRFRRSAPVVFICCSLLLISTSAFNITTAQRRRAARRVSKIDWSYLQGKAKRFDNVRLQVGYIESNTQRRPNEITLRIPQPWGVAEFVFRATHAQYGKVKTLHQDSTIILKYTTVDQDPSWYSNWDTKVPSSAMDDIAMTKFLKVEIQ